MSTVIKTIDKIVAWFQRNERHLSTPIFIIGFLNDVITLQFITVSQAVYIYGGYVIGALLCTVGAHYLYVHSETDHGRALGETPAWFHRAARVTLALAAQFLTGGLLSGSLIFYTRGAALTASWPFIVLLAVIFIGNEYFRFYREKLAFRSVLFFFTTYAYAVFALPYFTHTLTQETFIESTAASLIAFLVFLIALSLAGWKRVVSSLLEIVVGTIVVLGLVMGSYFTGIIPPLPLSLRDAGVYHRVTHQYASGESQYAVQGESYTRPWWDIFGATAEPVQYVPGTSLAVFSAVFAPTSFSSGEVNTWQWYDAAHKKWVTQATIAFPISGGRDGGYRGYSTLTNIKEGMYRVSIETPSGQVIGRVYFDVTYTSSMPALITETR